MVGMAGKTKRKRSQIFNLGQWGRNKRRFENHESSERTDLEKVRTVKIVKPKNSGCYPVVTIVSGQNPRKG